MNSQGAWQRTLDFGVLPVVVEPVTATFSTDAGLLPMRQFDERLGLTKQFAAAIDDPRAQDRLDHSILEMVRSRVFGIVAGYEDCNDHDSLRSDPIFKLLSGRSPDDEDLASQPTLSRFENLITTQSLFRLADVFLSQFLDSVTALGPDAPRHLTLDLDVFDDPTHGAQQLTFFHGFYEQYQYMSRVLTCANNDQIAVVALLHGTARATLGAADDVKRVVTALRERWPGVHLHLRTDSGFATPEFYLECEQLAIDYTIGLPMNAVLKRQTEEKLAEAVRQFEQTGQPQRLFEAFEYQAESWDQPRWVVVKCEANAQGTNRRAVVTNRPGARVMPAAAYDEYGERGESENRNKEVKCGFHADRLSCHRYKANYFRLYEYCLATNLLSRLRQLVAAPPEPDPPSPLPPEALAGRDRKRYFNQRRKADPLGEGHVETWRMMLIKVAAEVVVSTRRVLVRLSGSWPYQNFYLAVCEAVQTLTLRPAGNTS